MSEIYFDLGGTKKEDGYQRVNLVGETDVRADITELDSFCEDGTVLEFRLNHTLEHIPQPKYRKFLEDMRRKLAVGGFVRVVQTDARKIIEDYHRGKLSFRALRAALFTPGYRVADNPLQQHQSAWDAETLAHDFLQVGYDRAERFDAGHWGFDLYDAFEDLSKPLMQTLKADQGVRVHNLGVAAWRMK